MSPTSPVSSPAPARARPFTGGHMAAVMCAFFGIVIAVNFAMARLAVGTFSGVVVGNSYEASQNFNRWLDEAAREKALGWNARAARAADGRIVVTIARDGVIPLPPQARLGAEAVRPLGLPDDRALAFEREAAGRWRSTRALPAGRWKLRLRLECDDKKREPVFVDKSHDDKELEPEDASTKRHQAPDDATAARHRVVWRDEASI